MSLPPRHAIVLDDHPLVGRGIAQYLVSLEPGLDVSVATQWAEVLALQAERGAPCVVVADVWLADGHCLSLLSAWRQSHPDVPWLAMSGDDDPAVVGRVKAAGANGFVHKQASPEAFAAALQAVLAGTAWHGPDAVDPNSAAAPAPRSWAVTPDALGLTLRQGEILQLITRGLPNKRIALQLGISEATVKEHVTGILERLGARNRVEAIASLGGRRMVLPHEH